MQQQQRHTQWEGSNRWYDILVGDDGHYYHKGVILPKLLPLFDFEKFPSPSLLDMGCGQGVLARALPPHVAYCGIDLAPSLIAAAKKKGGKGQTFILGDCCAPLPIQKQDFTHGAFLLSLQNMDHPEKALAHCGRHLIKGGILALVLNHPCFRIPRQSGWEIDPAKKLQYRRVDRYLSPLKIPLQMHPSKGEASETTWSFHHSLSDYSRFLAEAGFVIVVIEEWISNRESTGKGAKMENRARSEFPLFLTLLAQKIT